MDNSKKNDPLTRELLRQLAPSSPSGKTCQVKWCDYNGKLAEDLNPAIGTVQIPGRGCPIPICLNHLQAINKFPKKSTYKWEFTENGTEESIPLSSY